ncbi:MAG: HlyD family efflux transporter periplasmic adaptor subunit [Planctomycetaceae bacterium]|jgi:multidrug efflux pump subunit AcrA (membrane-fusion protein)|nr:HlyD family efflux transporter periplasmic adaptor subunit [Planctomycetaceae bacterium]MDC0308156.1 HlyD family efflux transporter periplasmic adaptor subunit [Planctomycetaceae bacterium]MDG2390247.1 HlyD family efflux transporter periplasmic adaptor subunit [Planctomycetaceae bacterium]
MLNEALKIISPILVLAAGVLGYVVFGQPQRPPQDNKTVTPAELVEVQSVERFTKKIKIEFDGLVIPYRRINLSAEIAGRVTEKPDNLQAGSFVKEGIKLLEIDKRFYQLEVDRLTAEKEQTEAAGGVIAEQVTSTQKLIVIAEDQRKLEEANIKRSENLRERGAITQSQYEADRKTYLSIQNSVTTLENQLNQLLKQKFQNQKTVAIAQAKIDQAQRDLDLSTLKAPISGLIVDDFVEKDDFVQRGTALFQLEDTSKVEISSNLKMEEFGWLIQSPQSNSAQETSPELTEIGLADAYRLPENDVKVTYELAGVTYEWEGQISRLAGTGLDPKTRMVPCRVTVPEPRTFIRSTDSQHITSRSPRTLMNGMFVKMSTGVVPGRPLLSLPERGVRPGNIVWLVSRDGLRVETIKVVHRQDGRVLIHEENSPLLPGDKVIVSQLSEPEVGMKLKAQPTHKPSDNSDAKESL